MRAVHRPLATQAYAPLLETSRQLADRVGEPALDAFVSWVEGIVALYGSTDMPLACRQFGRAERLLRERCPEERWLLTNTRMVLGAAMTWLGEHGRLATECRAWITDAVERQDRFAHAALMGNGGGFIGHLMNDNPTAALTELDQSMAAWPPEPFSTPHMGQLFAMQWIALYQGGSQLHQWLSCERQRLGRAVMLRVPVGRTTVSGAGGVGAIAACVAASRAERARFAREARRCVNELQRIEIPTARAGSWGINAQLLALDGKLEPALVEAARARHAVAALGMFQQHAVGYLEGLLEGGEGGREKRTAALAFFRDQGWKNPERAIQMVVPVLPALEAPEPRSARRPRPVFAGRYEVVDILGQGGYGSVTGARDVTTGRRAAIKELTRTSPQALYRFKQEFRALQALRHPRLVRLDALFEHEGRWFIAMPWVEGTDLRRWVRPSGRLEVERVREAFAGLAEGLLALHEAGFCHRDVKPENVRVTPEGRVVLLDFGLIAELSEESDDDPEVGTAAYMAPEQKPGAPIGPEADLYAMGVCLYEALCGKLPFDGELPLHILQNKRRGRPPPAPSQRAPREDIPVDLEALALALLDARPEARPAVASLPARLRGETEAPGAHASRSLRPANPVPLTGRDAELTLLDLELARTEHGTPRVVLIEGDSGIGKSALVDHWLKRVRDDQPTAVVLRGRCYENEKLPYSALDGMVDELSRLLRRLGPQACAALLPPHAAVLAELFAVLGSVRGVGDAPRKGILAEPHARRRQGFDALRSLLSNLCAEGPLVLAVDDLQWADLESFRLLRALLREQGAPPLLLVATVRARRELSAEHAEAVDELAAWPCSARISVGPLQESHARRLVARLLDGADARTVERVVAQAHGHPLFLDELATHARTVDASGALTLDTAVAARLEALQPHARRLLELVALAGRPHGLHVYERALADLEDPADTSLDEAIAVLSAAKLLRVRKDQQLVCFHDRIRAVATRGVAEAAWQPLHLALARVLDAEPEAEPAERARLWDEGGEPSRAAAAYEQAGAAALEALAFQQSAALLARALKLTPSDDEARLRRTVLRAHALARGGHSADAAALYQEAAQAAQGEERVRLGIWAAQHLLQSAQVEPGLEAARALLAELDMGLPRGEKAALTRIAWHRARMGLRGLALKPAPKGGIDARTRLQLEAAWQLAAPVAAVDVLPSATLSAAHLRRALDSGDPAHAARALAQEASMRAIQKPFVEPAYVPLLETSRKLADRVGDPALDAFVTWVEGLTAAFRDDYSRALDPFRRAEQVLREQCSHEPWLLTNVRSTLGTALWLGGEHRTLVEQSKAWLADAQERGDRFAETTLFGMGNGFVQHLMDDNPEAARAELRRTMDAWPREPFSNAGVGELSGTSIIECYVGGPGLLHWLDAERPRLSRALMLKLHLGKVTLAAVSIGARIGAAVTASEDERGRLMRGARAGIALLKREQRGLAYGGALLADAQLLAMEGRPDAALDRTSSAREAFEAISMFQAHGAAYLQGLLEGGDTGRERRERAVAFFRDQGWKRPERAVAMLLPALPALEAR
jgi:tetratricopeptide (TPR) repeat protein